MIDGLPTSTPDIAEERRGPRVGAPQAAIDGFLKSAGVALAQCEKRDTGKGEFWFAKVETKGRATADVAKDWIERALAAFPWPKSMRWGSGRTIWARPIHSILCLFDGAVVGVEFASVNAGNTARGHRFLAPQQFVVASFADYRAKLRAAHVILDHAERLTMIRKATNEAAAKLGLTVKPDEGLLDEVTGLVEWPVVLTGSIDQQFMSVPPEVLITAMRAHQKISPCSTRRAGWRRVFSSSPISTPRTAARRSSPGTTRAARPAVGRALFLGAGQEANLELRVPKLADRVSLTKGSAPWPTRSSGCAELARLFAQHDRRGSGLGHRAAFLAKADLTTEMVGEFPELQGVMDATTRPTMGRTRPSPKPSPSITSRRGRTTPVRPRRSRLPWLWPTSSIRWRDSSRSAKSPPVRRIRSRCAAPGSA